MSTQNVQETVQTAQGSSSASDLEEAERLFQQGLDGIRENKLEAAVEALGKALEIRTGHYGETAPETATTYHKYGSALFYKAVEDSGVFGSKVPETVGSDEEDEDDEDEEPEGTKEDVKADVEGKGKEKMKAEDEEEDEENEEADVSDMEMAWQMLETARVIYGNVPGSMKGLAEVHERLADISMEEERFEEAVSDYQTAIQYLQNCPEPQQRATLGVLFQLAMALQMQEEYIKAEAKCKEAVELCNTYIAERCQNPDDQDAINEAKEMKGVLEDLSLKHEELLDLAKQEKTTKETMKSAFASMMGPMKGSGGGASATSSSASPFDAPQLTTSSSSGTAATTTTQVTNLGVVGRGRNRVTPVPVPVAGGPGVSIAAGNGALKTDAERPKVGRSLDDLMGGGGGVGVSSTIGFGSSQSDQGPATQVVKRAKVSFAEP